MNSYETKIITMPNGCEIEIVKPILSDAEKQKRIEHLKTTASEVLKHADNRSIKTKHNERTDFDEETQKKNCSR